MESVSLLRVELYPRFRVKLHFEALSRVVRLLCAGGHQLADIGPEREVSWLDHVVWPPVVSCLVSIVPE